MNVFGMKKVKVEKRQRCVNLLRAHRKPNMTGVKTTGVKMRGTGAATKGTMARGPMG